MEVPGAVTGVSGAGDDEGKKRGRDLDEWFSGEADSTGGGLAGIRIVGTRREGVGVAEAAARLEEAVGAAT
jgi:hypothetical protein